MLRGAAATAPALKAPSPLAHTALGESAHFAVPGEQERLHRLRSARGLGPDAALAVSGEKPSHEVARVDPPPPEPPSCGGQVVPADWPDFSSSRDELLAPFLTCSSPGEVLALRTFLGDFDKPRVETSVGVRKPGPGLRYADVLIIEEGRTGAGPRHVETFSFKSRDLARLEEGALRRLVIEDAKEALRKYGGSLDIRRHSLQRSFGAADEVSVQRVRLVYEGGALTPTKRGSLDAVVTAAEEAVPGVEVLFQ